MWLYLFGDMFMARHLYLGDEKTVLKNLSIYPGDMLLLGVCFWISRFKGTLGIMTRLINYKVFYTVDISAIIIHSIVINCSLENKYWSYLHSHAKIRLMFGKWNLSHWFWVTYLKVTDVRRLNNEHRNSSIISKI